LDETEETAWREVRSAGTNCNSAFQVQC